MRSIFVLFKVIKSNEEKRPESCTELTKLKTMHIMTVLGIVKTRTAEHNSKKLEHISITNIMLGR